MSVLSIVQQHCRLNSLNVPSTVVSSTDSTVVQILAILNDIVDEIMDQDNYQASTIEKTFTLIAAEDQGALTTVLGADYHHLHNGTMFDRTLRRPVYGPLTDVEWQEIKALPNPGPWYKFRLRGNHLLINPTPSASLSLSTIGCEYASTYGVQNSGGTAKAEITADTDTFVLPERLIKKALIFKWKRLKGMPYADEETEYYNLLNNFIARDKAPRSYNMGNCTPMNLKPGIFVPSASWPVT